MHSDSGPGTEAHTAEVGFAPRIGHETEEMRIPPLLLSQAWNAPTFPQAGSSISLSQCPVIVILDKHFNYKVVCKTPELFLLREPAAGSVDLLHLRLRSLCALILFD